jgi:hypothetical protein
MRNNAINERQFGGGGHAFLKLHIHEATHLELDRPLGGHLDPFERLGILSDPLLAVPDFKHAKVAEFQAIALPKLVGHLVEEFLDDFLDDGLRGLGLFGDSGNQFFFRYRVHVRPFRVLVPAARECRRLLCRYSPGGL